MRYLEGLLRLAGSDQVEPLVSATDVGPIGLDDQVSDADETPDGAADTPAPSPPARPADTPAAPPEPRSPVPSPAMRPDVPPVPGEAAAPAPAASDSTVAKARQPATPVPPSPPEPAPGRPRSDEPLQPVTEVVEQLVREERMIVPVASPAEAPPPASPGTVVEPPTDAQPPAPAPPVIEPVTARPPPPLPAAAATPVVSRDAPAAAPAVNIRIGRIVVQPPTPPARPGREVSAERSPHRTLAEYLAGRGS